MSSSIKISTDPSWDGQMRINLIMSRMADLRKAYHDVKGELAAIDRRRKKLRRKEREGKRYFHILIYVNLHCLYFFCVSSWSEL